MANNNQRDGVLSNSSVGKEFQTRTKRYFEEKLKIELKEEVSIKIGISTRNSKEDHKFDLGNDEIIVECKSHRWTVGDNIPSAKISVWNEAMYYFSLAPNNMRKILFVERHYSDKKKKTLGQHYIETHRHLIPDDVEIWEYDKDKDTHLEILKSNS